MKRLLLCVFVALGLSLIAGAVPAYRGLIRCTQPDGSVLMLRQGGDEFCHWWEDASGNVLEKGADGYFRPVSESVIEARRAAGSARRAQANIHRRNTSTAGPIASGEKHFLVILVEFQDVHFASSTANADFTALLNSPGYDVNGGTGSARDFYYDNSHGTFEPIFDVYGPIRISGNMADYGGNDANGDDIAPEEAVIAGCNGLNGSIDFSQYDNDGDGEVDLVFMYYAGYGEASYDEEDSIWPHQWELTSAGKSLTLDGKKIDKYACTNELNGYAGSVYDSMCGIGTACHEFGHAMGLPDMYDTDGSTNGEAGGLYSFSTMCSGSYNNEGRTPPYFNIEERIFLGWLDESVYRQFGTSGDYTFGSVNNNVAYKSETDQPGEYFVYECRNLEGWDAGLKEAGLLVYHVDKSSRKVNIGSYSVTASLLWSNWTSYNRLNENGSHPCFYIIPAKSQSSLNYVNNKGYEYSSGYTFNGSTGRNAFTGTSWNGVTSDVVLTNISYNSTTGKVTLHASVPSSTLNYNVISNPGNGSYTAGSPLTLSLVESAAQPVSSVEWYFDDEPVSGQLTSSPFTGPTITLTSGTHLVEAHLTLASGVEKILELVIVVP